MHLLVVDWDFFFPNPDAGAPMGSHPELYGWPVAEDEHHTEVVWVERAKRFSEAGVPLPTASGWGGFWGRFWFTDGAPLIYADSNAWAGHLWPSDVGGEGSWDTIHLYDAHHDAGCKLNHASFEEWKASGDGIRCENWMLAHAWAGAELHVHFPPWRESLDRPTEEPLVEVAMSIDDGVPPPVAFSACFVCRSGAWVPPWEDHTFSAFLKAAPLRAQMHPKNKWMHPRPDPRRIIEMQAILSTKVQRLNG
ncbi:hypothetical protein ADL22_12430 [Streptomyces sp. NRRL F-4489]|uniref:hypothetical protein n=1 Tax=Streptomyces sp. NRRL F-4489 TaxID=1609095 RepID=UPI0007496B84|nr:hypothetical protein [Streptomyces sp. NRRL F-4489]KUL44744.1 hypothetical protein ADL22_12430 [Streptomyces sp. NRRL F-4489]